MRRALIVGCTLLLVIGLATPSSEGRARKRYVPFLHRMVKVSALQRRVHALDVSFRDYGAVRARKDFGLTGRGVEVCIVDTGVDATHEQLDAGKVVAFADFTTDRTSPAPGQTDQPYDDQGHGTHVASIVAGDGQGGPLAFRYRGVAPAASISAAKVLDAQGSGSTEQVIDGIAWCVSRGADIISMSLGGGATDGTDVLSEAVNTAVSQGVVVVVAAGNAGSAQGTIASPGSAKLAITVGASSEWSGKRDNREKSYGPYLAPFSSRGGNTEWPKPDVVAPGVTVAAAGVASFSDPTGYAVLSGTSMATPYVSGTVALMLQADPTLSPDRVRDILRGTAFDAGPAGWDPDWGYGLVNSYSAVARVEGQPERDIFPFHYYAHGVYPSPGAFPTYRLYIGNPDDPRSPMPPVATRRPLAVTVNITSMTNTGKTCDDFDLMLGEISTRQSWLASRPWTGGLSMCAARTEVLGITPPVRNGPYGYVLNVFPGIYGRYDTGAGAFDIDVFFGAR